MIPTNFRAAGIGILSVCLLAGTATAAAPNAAGVPNFDQVNEHIYRGAQPTAQGFQNLARLGVKTVIDLREGAGRSAQEEKAVKAAGMRYVAIPMNGLAAPSQAQIEKVMALFTDENGGPVFVHCKRGADRTGTVVACYRIAHDKWENRKALQEAKSHGMHWFEIPMMRYVMAFHAPAAAPAATAVTAAVQ